jgi:hypothetical protein
MARAFLDDIHDARFTERFGDELSQKLFVRVFRYGAMLFSPKYSLLTVNGYRKKVIS